MIYFDNNATTFMSPEVKQKMLEWTNRGNPSASYESAQAAQKMIKLFRARIGKVCGFNPCCNGEDTPVGPDQYKIIFTSGASESNCTLIRSIVDSYARILSKTPHIVASAYEHKSILLLLECLEDRGDIELTLVKPVRGIIVPEFIARAIRPNTCLAVVMHANNETGAINDIRAIGKVCHSNGVPFHTDAVQTFGKYPPRPVDDNVDSFSVSFHKMGAPPGIGALVVKRALLEGYKLDPLIFGTQNDGLRGGTENLPGIGAASLAFEIAMRDRNDKNAKLGALKREILTCLIPLGIQWLDDYVASPRPGTKIVIISPKQSLPNTIMLAAINACNKKMKAELEKYNIIISVGSACNTNSRDPSHVLDAMEIPTDLMGGTIRVSLGDSNTSAEVKKFCVAFATAFKSVSSRK